MFWFFKLTCRGCAQSVRKAPVQTEDSDFLFITSWHFMVEKLLIVSVTNLVKTRDYWKGFIWFVEIAKSALGKTEVTFSLQCTLERNVLVHPRSPWQHKTAWTELHLGPVNKCPVIFISQGWWRYCYGAPLCAFPGGPSTQISVALWSSFQVSSQLKWFVSCDCANNHCGCKMVHRECAYLKILI